MIPRLRIGSGTLSALALAFAACSSTGDSSDLVSVPLAQTRLIGDYALVDYSLEYSDGRTLNQTTLKISGSLVIGADSSYAQSVNVNGDSTLTQGKILQTLVEASDKDQGRLSLSLTHSDSSSPGATSFAFHHDTLVWITDVPKGPDPAKLGYTETDYYTRNPAP